MKWIKQRLRIKAFYGTRRESPTNDCVRIYDHIGNSRGKTHTRGKVRRMRSKFSNVTSLSCDPIRRHLRHSLNRIDQLLFARWPGFWLLIEGRKPWLAT